MPTLSVSTANKQHAVLTLDSGTKPSGTEKYQIERKESKKNQDLKQTVGFQRVLERAVLQVKFSEREIVEAIDVLVALFEEQESFGVYLLKKQGITRLMLLETISHSASGTKSVYEQRPEYEDDLEQSEISKTNALEKFARQPDCR